MKNKKKFEKYEHMYGPHFNEKYALMAVEHMVNEDGTKGAHWTIEQTSSVAQQYGVNLNTGKYNKYDWFVTMNMFYSDYYKAIVSMTNSDNVRYYVDLSKAWLEDKDVDEGKMWYYYKYVICDEFRTEDDDDDDDMVAGYDEYDMRDYPRERSNMRRTYRRDDSDWDDDNYYGRNYSTYRRGRYMSRY